MSTSHLLSVEEYGSVKKMKKHVLNFALLSCIASLALSGCNSQQPPAAAPDAAQKPQQSAPVESKVDAPIAAESLDVGFELASPPAYIEGQDMMRLDLRVQNKGSAMIVGQGKAPVNVGVILVGPDGPDVAPGRREFVRVPLPVVAPGATADIVAELPAKDLQRGLKVRVELVQEGVAWFPQFGLDVGNFERCAGNDKTLCDADGTALTAK
jgi:hypothetical protein